MSPKKLSYLVTFKSALTFASRIGETSKYVFHQRPYNMDETFLKKFRNLVSTCPKSEMTWTELSDSPSSASQATADLTRRLVSDFLQLVSGDEVSALLDDVLSPRQKEELPALGSQADRSGSKRLAKLNAILRKSPPLKPWTIRSKKDESVSSLEIWQWKFQMLSRSQEQFSWTFTYIQKKIVSVKLEIWHWKFHWQNKSNDQFTRTATYRQTPWLKKYQVKARISR